MNANQLNNSSTKENHMILLLTPQSNIQPEAKKIKKIKSGPQTIYLMAISALKNLQSVIPTLNLLLISNKSLILLLNTTEYQAQSLHSFLKYKPQLLNLHHNSSNHIIHLNLKGLNHNLNHNINLCQTLS